MEAIDKITSRLNFFYNTFAPLNTIGVKKTNMFCSNFLHTLLMLVLNKLLAAQTTVIFKRKSSTILLRFFYLL